MTLRVRATTMRDVHALFSDLSEISAAEVAKECGSWWAALPKVQKLLELRDAHTEVMLDEAGTPMCIFGHYPSGEPGIRTTWFVFSKTFIERGVAGVVHARRYLKALRHRYPDTYFHSFTVSDHPERDRWFRLLGYHYTGLTADGAHHYVLLVPENADDKAPVGRYNPTNPQAL